MPVTITLTVDGRTYTWEATEITLSAGVQRQEEDGQVRLLEDNTPRLLEAA